MNLGRLWTARFDGIAGFTHGVADLFGPRRCYWGGLFKSPNRLRWLAHRVADTKLGDSPRAVGEGDAVGLPSSTADSVAESNVLCEPAPRLHLLLESRRDPPVVALRLPPANGFDPSGIRCPGRPIRVVIFSKRGDSPRVFSNQFKGSGFRHFVMGRSTIKSGMKVCKSLRFPGLKSIAREFTSSVFSDRWVDLLQNCRDN